MKAVTCGFQFRHTYKLKNKHSFSTTSYPVAYFPTQQLKLYRNFKAIEATDYYELIRYYERNEDSILRLDFDAYFDCTARYTEALFQTEEYGKHLVMVDHLLQVIIENNVETHDGQDIYVFSLLRKGTSLFFQKSYKAAEHCLRETIKIAPWERQPVRLLRSTMLRQAPYWMRQVRSIVIIGVLSAVILRVLTYLIVQPYFNSFTHWADATYFVFLGGGLSIWVLGELCHYTACVMENRQFVNQMLKRKLGK